MFARTARTDTRVTNLSSPAARALAPRIHEDPSRTSRPDQLQCGGLRCAEVSSLRASASSRGRRHIIGNENLAPAVQPDIHSRSILSRRAASIMLTSSKSGQSYPPPRKYERTVRMRQPEIVTPWHRRRCYVLAERRSFWEAGSYVGRMEWDSTTAFQVKANYGYMREKGHLDDLSAGATCGRERGESDLGGAFGPGMAA